MWLEGSDKELQVNSKVRVFALIETKNLAGIYSKRNVRRERRVASWDRRGHMISLQRIEKSCYMVLCSPVTKLASKTYENTHRPTLQQNTQDA